MRVSVKSMLDEAREDESEGKRRALLFLEAIVLDNLGF
jgi:hypothetical protein